MIREYYVKIHEIGDSEEEHFLKLRHEFFKNFSTILPNLTRKQREEKARELVISHDKYSRIDVEKAIDFLSGYEILDPLILDDNVEEIFINGTEKPIFIYHRKFGKCKTNLAFRDERDILRLIEKIKIFTGVSSKGPIINASLPEGIRINLTLSPVSSAGMTHLTIRKHMEKPPSIIDLIKTGTMDKKIAAFLWMAVDGFGIAPRNIIITGATGSGKTTLLNALLTFSREHERIVSIEDTPDLNLSYCKDWVRTKTTDDIDMEKLVENSLRLRPDRIVVGEVRGREAYNLVSAMSLGHNGLGTIHANSTSDVITRLRSPPINLPTKMLSVINLIIILTTFYDRGINRKITRIDEIAGVMGETLQLGSIFEYNNKTKRVESSQFPVTTTGKIAEICGLTPKDVIDEIKRREIVLGYMVKNDISRQEDFIKVVKAYYKSPEKILNSIRKSRNDSEKQQKGQVMRILESIGFKNILRRGVKVK